MADGDTDAEGPSGGQPLPRADRVWRHPSEAAMESRLLARAARRSRRRRAGTAVVGLAGAAALLWFTRVDPAETTVASDPAQVDADGPGTVAATSAAATAAPTTTLLVASLARDAATTPASAPPEMILIRPAESSDALGGAIVVRDGYVITSGQAVAGATEILVSIAGRSIPGTVVGHDAATDIAVIRVDTERLPIAGSGATIATGDTVTIALADGEHSRQTVVETASASVLQSGEVLVGIVELDGRIGSITPGTPAYDDHGAIVGVTSATADTAPAALVSIDLARAVADDIIAAGVADHPWLGVTARTSDGEPPGSQITAVVVDGPAARGGVEVGDVVVAVDHHAVGSMEAMVASLRGYEPGATVTIEVDRAGEPVTCVVVLDSFRDIAA